MTKRILSLILAILTMFTLCAPAFASAEPAEEPAADVTEEVPVTEDIPVIEETPEAAPEEAPAEEPTPEEAPAEVPETVEAAPADEPEEAAATSGTCGANLKWTVKENGETLWGRPAGTLTISGTGNMPDRYIGPDGQLTSLWTSDYPITKVVIQDGVTSIGAYAFYNWGVMPISVSIADSVTSIGEAAFCWSTQLSAVTLPKNLKTIGESAFNVTSLTSVTVPTEVTDIGHTAFANCSGLKSITILSRNCVIPDDMLIWDSADLLELFGKDLRTAVVRGYAGSTAEAFAKKNGYTFEAIDDEPEVKNGLVTEGGTTYYYKNDAKQKGLVKAGGRVFYYCSTSDGHVMKGGWVKVDGVNKYYAGKDGQLYTATAPSGARTTTSP